ncbi:hypothetical protein DFQ01_11524 [Paenibacillus cellulosilyticus]|uniref:Uncharacterized protein n=1 Tax=Paenibacillus cellulosilyticus TaxID=375489 RepID=A0A2V2YQL0_9BACL|nr:hypothetical protein [Paenibacillus cellulosilyticus]PWV99308.1 hypothetical protein DFQ01_11524 [Paenibacillus cellulosilyticus]QKS45073.1 hypothetical protein HUB94_12095 [Paenibacillus cellulosilyticus]
MNNSVFGELVFNVGWKAATDISLFNNVHSVTVKAAAYFEKDGITAEQETAFVDFGDNKRARLATVEKLLIDYANGDASNRFVPRTLLFKRNGSYALLLDDSEDEDEGIAVCLAPSATIVSQSEYL